jgi:hypothetical protein
MEAFEVSKEVGNVRNNSVELLNRRTSSSNLLANA